MRNETTQQLDLPNIFETATNDIIDENEGIQDVEKGTFVAPISNTVCMYILFNPKLQSWTF